MRIVDVITGASHTVELAGIAEHFDGTDFW